MYDLLNDRLFTWRGPPGDTQGSLPELFAALNAGTVTSLPNIRDHHRQFFHSFCCQLAAVAPERAGATLADITDAKAWRTVLRGLTTDWPNDEPWHLIVEDPTAPAFMQPPLRSAGEMTELTNDIAEVDTLDLLVTSKNWDVKAARSPVADAETWVHHLITWQTGSGYSGRGWSGIARMNGGYASRPAIGLAWSTDPSTRFRRDAAVLARAAQTTAEDLAFDREGHALLWCYPWGGTGRESFSLADLHPWFIEVSRRIRLRDHDGSIAAKAGTTAATRIAAKELNGATGDPWSPIWDDGKTRKCLTVQGSGWNYRLLCQLLLRAQLSDKGGGDWHPGCALVFDPSLDGDRDELQVIGQVLARGQGQTDGFHERVITIPTSMAQRLENPGDRAIVLEIARTRIDTTGTVQNRILKPAIASVQQAGRDSVELAKPWAVKQLDAWMQRFDAAVDACFFDHLFASVTRMIDDGADDRIEDHAWAMHLCDIAQAILSQAIESTALPTARRYRAISAANGRFAAARKKHFPEPTLVAETAP